jgi:hypothetical protein
MVIHRERAFIVIVKLLSSTSQVLGLIFSRYESSDWFKKNSSPHHIIKYKLNPELATITVRGIGPNIHTGPCDPYVRVAETNYDNVFLTLT